MLTGSTLRHPNWGKFSGENLTFTRNHKEYISAFELRQNILENPFSQDQTPKPRQMLTRQRWGPCWNCLSFQYPQRNYTPEDTSHQELSQPDNVWQEIFPYQWDYNDYILPLKIPSGIFVWNLLPGSEDNPNSQLNHYSKACNLHLEKLPSPMVSKPSSISK